MTRTAASTASGGFASSCRPTAATCASVPSAATTCRHKHGGTWLDTEEQLGRAHACFRQHDVHAQAHRCDLRLHFTRHNQLQVQAR